MHAPAEGQAEVSACHVNGAGRRMAAPDPHVLLHRAQRRRAWVIVCIMSSGLIQAG